MIVKIVGKTEESISRTERFVDCVEVLMMLNKREPGDDVAVFRGYCLIFTFANGADRTLDLSDGDKVFYLNDAGQTIDRDFRMAGVKTNLTE